MLIRLAVTHCCPRRLQHPIARIQDKLLFSDMVNIITMSQIKTMITFKENSEHTYQ